MGNKGYKKYMKKEAQTENPLIKIFILSFFGMLLIFTFLIKSFSPTVDTSIGDYQDQSQLTEMDEKKIVDGRLEMIQSEDQGRNFTELMSKVEDVKKSDNKLSETKSILSSENTKKDDTSNDIVQQTPQQDPIYKVFIGSYTSAEQAKVAKDIIIESGNGLNPIVKCIGPNNYTLQVGIFKNKQSAESMLYAVQQNHLPGRIVQDY